MLCPAQTSAPGALTGRPARVSAAPSGGGGSPFGQLLGLATAHGTQSKSRGVACMRRLQGT